ncbi:NADH:flavin oxidoreductase/NADH oxidase family protein [Sutcliffiella horikoshii]|uniref:NADH:flavin oxidoreductase/NADH oxidase family protein n=1 Tax=Sutcliffiella horikoshii TaxID=79883 RepID=UPI00203F60C7|nr:NADH:flavin oxidoreductase/NADH oxidase family protein [Sutcliffiella horikoshii]MCM3616024.1 NADH:flavin oxidoreductase/NADH oxidase family protein [Sutcliffiella horikoshii]
MVQLHDKLVLPNGSEIKNRFFKAAMSEGMADKHNRPTGKLVRLYETWAESEAGIVVTGNVMVDKRALGEPRNVVVENEKDLELLKSWANAGTKNKTHLWMQINHPGKQVFKGIVKEAVAPSKVEFDPKLQRYFPVARELQEEEIIDIIQRFANTAKIAKKAGFTGIQLHGAHGYLISQFLSPRHNKRTDQWGGSLENRMRFLLEVFKKVRQEVGDTFPIGVKLNSADFMKAGFSEEEALHVIKVLDQLGIDLIEISGGSYESPQMTGVNVKESTKNREAYFLEFATEARKVSKVPLVVTGGFRTMNGMKDAVLEEATSMVGLARPMAVYPYLPKELLQGKREVIELEPRKTGIKLVDQTAMLELTWYSNQLERIGNGQETNPRLSPKVALLQSLWKNGLDVFQMRRV